MPHAIHISRSTSWLPPALRLVVGRQRYRITFSEPERKVFRKHKKIPVSRWCERYRHVTMSVLPGKWKNEVTPYLAGIMDASWYPTVQEIVVCKAPQVGGTEAVLNCLAYAIDRDPGPALCIYPDELTAKENSQDRIQPMIKGSPRLRSYMTGVDDDSSSLRINLQHMVVYMAWARSAARLANKPIRYLICDEIDKYVDTAGKRETDPIRLGEARTITYRYNRKIWKFSTPTTESGNVTKAMAAAQVVFDFWVSCPACGADQKMVFGQIKWAHKEEPGPDGKCHSEDPGTIEAEKLAWYECPHCLAQWNDYERDAAVRSGGWRERVPDERLQAGAVPPKLFEVLRTRRPVKIGFHIPSWLSTFVPLSTVASAFLYGQTDINAFKDFHNKHLAIAWKLTVISGDEAQILAARCPLPAQVVPDETVALTVGVDVQKNGFWFVVKAWAASGTSWTIHYGFLATWADVEKLIFETSYPMASTGKTMRPFRACVDTGGGEKFEDMTMTDETYLWLLKNRGRNGVALWGTKGASSAMPGMLKLGAEILMTSKGKKLPAGLRILSVDTTKAKDQFHWRLDLAGKEETRALPGAAFLHAGTGSDYVAQILAEEKQRDEKGHEEWVNIHQRPNHLLDAEVLAAACVEMEFPGGGLRLIAGAAQNRPAQRKVVSKGINS